jgi:hypothetical protein
MALRSTNDGGGSTSLHSPFSHNAFAFYRSYKSHIVPLKKMAEGAINLMLTILF